MPNNDFHPRCFDRTLLVAFALGKLPDHELERIAAEIETCPDCQVALEALDSEEDSVVRDVRVFSTALVLPVGADLAAAIRQAEQISGEIWFHRSPKEPPSEEEPKRTRPLPSCLGQYELLDQIGRGGMGSVYKALHTRLKRHVALKILHPGRTREPTALARFFREMEAVGRLDHPNLVHAHDAGENDGQHYLVMELVEGVDLSRLVRSLGPLPVADACEAVRQAALGLQHAHEHGLVHRDVKPSNLMLTFEGRVKVLDLGLARLIAPSAQADEGTATGQVVGTGDYIAPEQAQDVRQADARSDVYALGCTLYFLLAGRAPFADPKFATFIQKILAHTHQPVPSIRQFCGDVPDGLVALLDRMLAKDPNLRIPSAAAVADSIGPFAQGANLKPWALRAVSDPPHAETPRPTTAMLAHETSDEQAAGVFHAPPPSNEKPQKRGKKPLVWLGSLALLGLLVAGSIVLQSGPRSGQRSEDENHSRASPGGEPDAWSQGNHPPPAIAPFNADEAVLHQRRWAEHLELRVEQPNSLDMKLVLIPAGQFEMGSSEAEISRLADEAQSGQYESWYLARLPAESPRHRVRIPRPFFLAAFETTVGQFRTFVDEIGYTTDAEKDGQGAEGPDPAAKQWTQNRRYSWRNPGYPQEDNEPVVAVSWNDATAFCRWLSKREGQIYRLPTEAEWEYACRAGTTMRYWFGDDPERLPQVDNLADSTLNAKLPDWAPAASPSDGYAFAAPVGRYRANPFGLHDLHGNVAEWCADWYDEGYYAESPMAAPLGPEAGMYRVLRGGHWGRQPYCARSALRSWGEPFGRTATTGFRVVRTISTASETPSGNPASALTSPSQTVNATAGFIPAGR